MRFRNTIGATALAVAALMFAIGGAAAFDESKYPDLKGQWRRAGRAVQSDRIGAPYDPKLHERVGSRRVDGMDALRVAEQRERGYASQQPEFVLRRPKVIVSE